MAARNDARITPRMERSRKVQRVLILGGGFGGIYTAYHLDRIFRRHAGVEITLVSRENYFLMTPLLFEAGSGVLEPRHAVNPIRPLFKKARFVEATVERIDLEGRKVLARHGPEEGIWELEYDQLVLALGGVTNRKLIPGSEHALGFKTLRDAIFLRNRIIDLFEQADVEEDPERRKKLLTFVVIGAGLVGVELMGELTEFTDNLLRSYPRISREWLRFVLVEASDKVLPEMERDMAEYAAEVLWKRGVSILTNTPVKRIEVGKVVVETRNDGSGEEGIESETILLAAGLGANPLLGELPLEKARNGRAMVEGSMRVKSRPEVWALGDCAVIPDAQGKPYPPLAQHALREAKVLAKNIAAVVERGGRDAELQAFRYETLGTMASLGHYDGVGKLLGVKVYGLLAWWVWRTYYVMQMMRWERRLRVIMDWTVAILFRNDIVKLDLFGTEHPTAKLRANEGGFNTKASGNEGERGGR